jgi:hypothetical protein
MNILQRTLAKTKKTLLSAYSNFDYVADKWGEHTFSDNRLTKTKWLFGDNHENYTKRGNIKYSTVEIDYYIDRENFRHKDSIPFNNDYKHIACFGCSVTAGIGLPWCETWPAVLERKFNNEYVVRNFGISGASADAMSRSILNYVKHFKPQAICCYFPEITRAEYFINNIELLSLTPMSLEKFKNWNTQERLSFHAYQRLHNEDNCIYNFIKNYKFIEMICAQHNIQFFWGTWSDTIYHQPKMIAKHFNIKNYADTSVAIEERDLARDGEHPGKIANQIIADRFFEKMSTK